jgi:organic radical activating enzyme
MDDLDKLRKEISNSKTFCFYPFLELSTRPNGSVLPCCYYDEQVSISTLEVISQTNPIDNFWNNKKIISIRNDLSQGKEVAGCNICYRDGSASMRVRSINENINNREYLKLIKDTIDNDGVAAHSPKILELKPSNLCNLKCFMCNAYDSSQIEKELNELGKKYNGVKLYGGRLHKINIGKTGTWEGPDAEFEWVDMSQHDWAESEEFWHSLTTMLPYIEILSFAGGEPTVNPVVQKILDYCVDNDYAKNITVFISSNFTNLNKKFFQAMPKFKKFELIASIDGTGAVQEYVRFPSNWNTIESNFQKARSYMEHPNIKIVLNITVNILNIAYIVDLLNWLEPYADTYPYYKEWPYNINLLNYPSELKVDWIHPDLRIKLIDDIKSYQNNSEILKFFPDLKIKTDLLISQLEQPFNSDDAKTNLKLLKNTIEVTDNHRGIDYSKSVPFLTEIFSKGLAHE